MSYKLKFNAPIVLIVTSLCVIFFLVDYALKGQLQPWMALAPSWEVSNIPRMFSYVLMHGSFAHLLGNLSIFLLIGPILEEKYGSWMYLAMCVLTAVITAVLNVLFTNTFLIGLSGIVFMNIVLVSFTNVQYREIPVTFILVLLLFVGQEVFRSFEEDNISQFAHILGGLLGSIFGFALLRRAKAKPVEQEELDGQG